MKLTDAFQPVLDAGGVYHVLWSMHSGLAELRQLVRFLKPRCLRPVCKPGIEDEENLGGVDFIERLFGSEVLGRIPSRTMAESAGVVADAEDARMPIAGGSANASAAGGPPVLGRSGLSGDHFKSAGTKRSGTVTRISDADELMDEIADAVGVSPQERQDEDGRDEEDEEGERKWRSDDEEET